jgi:hypothetical protein
MRLVMSWQLSKHKMVTMPNRVQFTKDERDLILKFILDNVNRLPYEQIEPMVEIYNKITLSNLTTI